GGARTVSRAAPVSAVPDGLANTARYSVPLSDVAGAGTVSCAVVLPGSVVSLAQLPPGCSTCHWTVGDGTPDAAAVKVAASPAAFSTLAGCLVTFGASGCGLTARVAAVVVAGDPTPLENLARYLKGVAGTL